MKNINEYMNPINEGGIDDIEKRFKSVNVGDNVIDMFKRHFNSGYDKVDAYMLADIILAIYTDLKK